MCAFIPLRGEQRGTDNTGTNCPTERSVLAFQLPIPVSTSSSFCASRHFVHRKAQVPKRPRSCAYRRVRIFSSFEREDIINDYRIVDVIGRGTTGLTYEVVATKGPYRSQRLAFKALTVRSLTNWKTLDLFQREARTLKSLSHPSIPKYVDFFEYETDSDTAYILVQKKAKGTPLQTLIDEGYRFATEQVKLTFVRLLEVLSYLASLNPPVLHCDVKPANIIVDLSNSDVALSLVDFGGVRTGITSPGSTLVGTYGFMAPEQFTGLADVRSDMYAAAATILCMLTAQLPSALPQKRLKIDLESVIPKREQAKLGTIYSVMAKLLEPAPEDRFDSPSEALAALNGVHTDRESSLHTVPNLLKANSTLSPEDTYSLEEALATMNTGEPKSNALKMLSLLTGRRVRRRKPAGSRIALERDRDNKMLLVSIPPKGVSSEALSRGAFTVAWTGFTAFWTLGVLTGGAPIVFSLFSLPFWAAGYRFARSTADEITGSTDIVISFGAGDRKVFYFGMASKSALGRGIFVEGDSRDLDRAAMETEMYVNGRPLAELVLNEGTRRHVFGDALDPVEQEWLRDEINDFISSQNGRSRG
ncbi:Serine/threonine protein kinase [Gracilaria domingensis]|nr:Serine/threonine protein kinase [Gracilaria domingensis]